MRAMNWWGALMLVSVMGCGDDSGGSSLDHGVSPNKSLEDLNTDEIQAICQARDRLFQRLGEKLAAPETTCRLVATSITSTTDACQQLYQECVQGGTDAGLGNGGMDDVTDELSQNTCPSEMSLEGCQVSVSEVDACVLAQQTAVHAVFDEPSCENPGFGSFDFAALGDALNPPECMQLDDTCESITVDADPMM